MLASDRAPTHRLLPRAAGDRAPTRRLLPRTAGGHAPTRRPCGATGDRAPACFFLHCAASCRLPLLLSAEIEALCLQWLLNGIAGHAPLERMYALRALALTSWLGTCVHTRDTRSATPLTAHTRPARAHLQTGVCTCSEQPRARTVENNSGDRESQNLRVRISLQYRIHCNASTRTTTSTTTTATARTRRGSHSPRTTVTTTCSSSPARRCEGHH